MKKYDFIVIGAGAAGLTAAHTACGLGKKVLLIDKSKPGGDCTWSGCIPSKTLIHLANEFNIVRKYCSNIFPDTEHIMSIVRKTIEHVYSMETPEDLKKSGIDFIFGDASFIDSKTVAVSEHYYTSDKIIICTGSRPFIPTITGINSVPYLTYDSFFKLKSLPRSIVILGGGPVGIELSQALIRLGIKVTLVEMENEILPKEDPELAHHLRLILSNEGINILTGFKATKITKSSSDIITTIETPHISHEVNSESVLIALGRVPNIDTLNLKKASVDYNKHGIPVNSSFQTSNKNIYASGDICSPYNFSHMANFQAITAVKNAFLPIKSSLDYSKRTWCTFTDPEFAQSGLTEDEARKKYGKNIKIYRFDLSKNHRSITEGFQKGIGKIIVNKKGLIIGATILGPHAGEIINEIQVARTFNIKLSQLSKVIHPYPTFGDFINKLGKNALVDDLLSNPIIKAIKKDSSH